jgi:hypothetical protein
MKSVVYNAFLFSILTFSTLGMESLVETKEHHRFCGYISVDYKEEEQTKTYLSGSCSCIGVIPSTAGKRAILLSAVHNFEHAIAGAPFTGSVSFEAEPEKSLLKPYPIESVYFPIDFMTQEDPLDMTDICVCVTTLLPTDTPLDIIELYDGPSLVYEELLECTLVGYGNMYGPNVSTKAELIVERKSCKTFASLKDNGKEGPAINTFLKSSVTFETFHQTLETNVESFEDTSDREIQVDKDTIVKCHPQQRMPSEGCSGGPLVYETLNGPRVLGAYAKTDIEAYFQAEKMPVVTLSVAPLQTNPWISHIVTLLKEGGTFEETDKIGVHTMKLEL